MRKSLKILALAIVLAAIPGSAKVPTVSFANGWEGLTPEQVQRVKNGEVVLLDKDTSKGTDMARFIQAALIVTRPIEDSWKLFRQTARQAEYLPKLYKCVTIEDKGSYDKVDFFVKFAFINIDYRVQHNFEPDKYYFHWALDPAYKNDLKELEGYWKLFKIDDQHTLARYGTNVNASDLIPKSIQEALTRKDLPESMEAVKKYFDSGGTYAKSGLKN